MLRFGHFHSKLRGWTAMAVLQGGIETFFKAPHPGAPGGLGLLAGTGGGKGGEAKKQAKSRHGARPRQ